MSQAIISMSDGCVSCICIHPIHYGSCRDVRNGIRSKMNTIACVMTRSVRCRGRRNTVSLRMRVLSALQQHINADIDRLWLCH